MKRSIIKIDEDKCTGCGNCIPGCPEGALQVIDGKARLVSDLFCDGLGACIGECPEGAMSVEEREAEPYDEYKVMANVVKAGANTIKAHLKHLDDHKQQEFLDQAIDYLKTNNIPVPEFREQQKPVHTGCPGMMQKDLREMKKAAPQTSNASVASEIINWPVQLQLINPEAPYLKNADLLIAADCTSFAFGNFHQRFLKDKVLMIFCPKLDTTLDMYIDKLAQIFEKQDINSITIIRMEVPCCGGVERVVQAALAKAQKNIIIKEYIVSITGELI